ncbi:hypothetical protein CPB84DRAFT_1958658 [Gymnopilus junonius]|uniref:Uncharacterized protein n=1 Tax=Gymnopilus junonius TaxID=109634 RepID=A0A9P5TRX0_GYMJU|nr:hypothetical protein CPB84DRAFT_1958658 [Gymnopilus junonius]
MSMGGSKPPDSHCQLRPLAAARSPALVTSPEVQSHTPVPLQPCFDSRSRLHSPEHEESIPPVSGSFQRPIKTEEGEEGVVKISSQVANSLSFAYDIHQPYPSISNVNVTTEVTEIIAPSTRRSVAQRQRREREHRTRMQNTPHSSLTNFIDYRPYQLALRQNSMQAPVHAQKSSRSLKADCFKNRSAAQRRRREREREERQQVTQ